MRRYTAIISRDEEGRYVASVPALPGCNTEGDTLEEAIANAREAIEGCLLALQDLGRPVPEEFEAVGAVVIEVAA